MAYKLLYFLNKHPGFLPVLGWEILGVLVDAGTGKDQWVGSQWMCLTGAATEQSVLVEQT